MFCPKCGTQLPDNAKFCNKCGEGIPDGVAITTSNASTTTNNSTQDSPDKLSANKTMDAFKIAQIVLGIILCIAFLMPCITASALGFSINISMKDLTFGMNILGSNISGSIWGAVAIVMPVIALVAALASKKPPVRGVVTILAAAILLAFMFLVQGQVGANGSGIYSMAAGYWIYIIGTIAQIAISIASIAKRARK